MGEKTIFKLVTHAAWVTALLLIGCGRDSNPTEPNAAKTNAAEQTQAVSAIADAIGPISDTSAQQSHRAMVEKLKQITADFEKAVPDFNSESVARIEQELVTANQDHNLALLIETHQNLAEAALRRGKTDLALIHLQRAYETTKQIRELTSQVADAKTKRILKTQEASVLYRLGVAALRKAEDENCIHCRTGESCILPIQGTGVHQNREGSEAAVHYLLRSLELQPDNSSGVWLLNLAAMTLGQHPSLVPEEFRISPDHFEKGESFPRFDNIASAVGVDTVSLAGGAIADDFDGDTLIDLVVSDWYPSGQLRFFKNLGSGSFRDITEQAGLLGITGGLNLVQTDFDNDGDLDIFVLRGGWLRANSYDGRHPNSLLRNEDGVFKDVTIAAGLAETNAPTQSGSWADYDNDGDLDLFIANEKVPCQLFQNNGQGRFVDVAKHAGVTNDLFAKGCTWGDFNSDRYPDLYVSNLYSANRLYLNNTDGTFTDVATEVGVDLPLLSFPTWFWDFNNDGHLDLFVSSYDMGVEDVGADFLGKPDSQPDRLYQGDGKTFTNVAGKVGLTHETQPMGCNFGDLDNDGFLDFYLATGYPDFDGLMPNLMFRNRGGKSFSDVTYAGGFGHLQKGHAVAFADFDHDGDQDIFTELGGWYTADAASNALFHNPGSSNHWIKIKLVGTRSNRAAIGARIKITVRNGSQEKSRSIYRWVTHGSSFGANPLRQEIGLGDADSIESLEVYWPTSDQTQLFTDVAADQFIRIKEGDDSPESVPLHAFSLKTPEPENEDSATIE